MICTRTQTWVLLQVACWFCAGATHTLDGCHVQAASTCLAGRGEQQQLDVLVAAYLEKVSLYLSMHRSPV